MTTTEKKIYIKIRAEQIKHFQDTENGHLLNSPYPIDKAMEIAEHQLNSDLENCKLRISLDELLLNDDNDCIEIAREGIVEIAETLK